MVLAPGATSSLDLEKRDRKMAKVIIDTVGLEPEKYRLGYTKVRVRRIESRSEMRDVKGRKQRMHGCKAYTHTVRLMILRCSTAAVLFIQ